MIFPDDENDDQKLCLHLINMNVKMLNISQQDGNFVSFFINVNLKQRHSMQIIKERISKSSLLSHQQVYLTSPVYS
jgi:hypothetical protein